MATFLPITSNFPNRGSRNFRTRFTMYGGRGIQTLRGAVGKGYGSLVGEKWEGAVIYILLHLSAT